MTEKRADKQWPRSMSGEADDVVMLGKVISVGSEQLSNNLTELELDLRFWASILGNPEFRAYFIAKSKFAGRSLILVDDEKWHQRWYKSPETGKESETDILLIFKEEESQRRFAFHIENKKATSSWQPEQAENYRLRAINRMSKWKYSDFELVLIAPSAFISAYPQQSCMFDRSVSYEELSRYIPEFTV